VNYILTNSDSYLLLIQSLLLGLDFLIMQ